MAVYRISRTAEVERDLLGKLDELAGPEGRLPTEAAIAQMFNVSRTTVRAAVGALVARGLVVRRQGMGSFVSHAARLANPLDEAIDFAEIIRRNGACPSIKFLNTALVALDQALAVLLNQPDGMALRRHTLYRADDEPVIYCINTLPRRVLPDAVVEQVLADPGISEPMYDFLATACQQNVEFSRATIWPDSAAGGGIPEGVIDPLTPVLVLEEVGYNGAGQPVLHSREYYPGRTMRFELIRRRGGT